ncbi:hypothetical protein Tco_0287244 [Tanacetum coccineum]
MESSNLNTNERELQLMQRLVKQWHSHCMAWFEQLKAHLRDLYINSSSHAIDAFKPAFHSLFGEEHRTFRLKMFHNLDQLRRQLERENLLELQSQDVQINPVQAVDDRLIVSKSNGIKSENTNALSKSVNETQLQQHESLVTESKTLEVNLNTDVKALDAGSVITESSGTKSDKHDTSSSPGTYITHAVDANIRPVNDQVPVAEKCSEAKLLTENEKLNEENEHLKQTYKELYDSIKMPQIQMKDYNDSLIAQVNTLKNELRKLKGNSMDTKFAKPSILGKPVLQPPRNHSVVRQPNVFKSERPNFSKPRFASQVDVSNVLSKPVTPHYFPKAREYVLAKRHHVIAPSSSKNSLEESYGSNDMAHNHYLEETRKKTQERNRNSKPSVMHTTSLQNTTNGSKPNPRSNNQLSRSLPASLFNGKMKFKQNSSSLVLQSFMMSVHISSCIALQQHMASADNTLGPAAQRKERCTPQCALSSEEDKSSCV